MPFLNWIGITQSDIMGSPILHDKHDLFIAVVQYNVPFITVVYWQPSPPTTSPRHGVHWEGHKRVLMQYQRMSQASFAIWTYRNIQMNEINLMTE